MDWLFDLVRQAYDRLADKIGQEWTIVLIAALIVIAIYLVIGRSK